MLRIHSLNTSRVSCIASNVLSDLLVCGHSDGILRFYCLKNFEVSRSVDFSHHIYPTSIWYSQGSNRTSIYTVG